MRFGATWIVTPDRSFFALWYWEITQLRLWEGSPTPIERYNSNVFSYELICPRCGWRTVCGVDDAITRLRLIGLLRREREPDEDVVASLFVEAAPRMTCPICKEKSLTASPIDVSHEDDEWQTAV